MLGASVAGASSLKYTWATTGTPPAAVTFSANGTNAAQNTKATFTAAGTYAFQVTITDALGQTTTSSVNVTVTQTPQFVSLSAAAAGLDSADIEQFTLTGLDQFGQVIPSLSKSNNTVSIPLSLADHTTFSAAANNCLTVFRRRFWRRPGEDRQRGPGLVRGEQLRGRHGGRCRHD